MNNLIKENRSGSIIASKEFLEEIDFEVLRESFFKYLLIYDVRTHRDYHCLEYSAYSPLFDSLKPGDIIPQYELEITTKHLKYRIKYTVKAVRL